MYQFANCRVRARVGEATPGQGHDGKYFFEISIWDVAGIESAGPPWVLGPWETEKIAFNEMRKAVKVVSDVISKAEGGKESDAYLDLKNGGVLRKFEEN